MKYQLYNKITPIVIQLKILKKSPLFQYILHLVQIYILKIVKNGKKNIQLKLIIKKVYLEQYVKYFIQKKIYNNILKYT